MSALKCTQCGHENDLTRVFCQNCGSRLERTEGDAPKIAAPTQVPTDRPAAVRRQKEKQGGGSGRLGGLLFSFVATVVVAAGFAAVIEMFRQPDNVPAAKAANDPKATQLYQGLKSFSDSTFARAIDVSQDQVNNFLACRLVPSDTADSSAKAKFTRAFVVIEQDKLRYFVEEEFHGLPLFVFTEYQPEVVDKALTMKQTGGGIGRLRFNEYLLPLLDRMVGPLAQSAVSACDVVQTLSGVDFKPGVATLRWSGSSKSPAPQQ